MKYPASYYKILFLVITMIGLFVSCTGKKSKTEKSVELELSKAGQVYQWSETEGQAFLSHMRNTYTTAEAWKKRAKEIVYTMVTRCRMQPSKAFRGYMLPGVSTARSMQKANSPEF